MSKSFNVLGSYDDILRLINSCNDHGLVNAKKLTDLLHRIRSEFHSCVQNGDNIYAYNKAPMKVLGKYDWECPSPGDYDSTWECIKCKTRKTESIDNLQTVLPIFGCNIENSKTIETVKKLLSEICLTIGLNTAQDYDGINTDGDVLMYLNDIKNLVEVSCLVDKQSINYQKALIDKINRLLNIETSREYDNLGMPEFLENIHTVLQDSSVIHEKVDSRTVIAIKERSAGNDQVGDMWLDSEIFDSNSTLFEVITKFSRNNKFNTNGGGKLILVVPPSAQDI